MDNEPAIRDLVERDGRFRLVKLGSFYLDPERDFVEGRDPVFGAVLKGRHGYEGVYPALVVQMAEEFAKEDPEIVARMLLERAEDFAANSTPIA